MKMKKKKSKINRYNSFEGRGDSPLLFTAIYEKVVV
jgi:hypothetical protein